MVFYRKYRPQSLDELIGQSHVKNTLLKAFASDKLSHAYLFAGPRGSGKTSTARILAKMVNCENPDKAPCNLCATCLSITDGSNLDLIEIDAASNRGIDDIRELRDRIKLAPTSSKKKVYIIDEVHMLTTEAFNALLKTLEEPPLHVLFILATTEPHKVPQTILSRVQKLDFTLAKEEELFEALSKVVKSEKLQTDEAALKLIAKKAEGSFRDALKLLDQLASASEKITVQSVNEALKSGSLEDQLGLFELIAQKDSKASLSFLSGLSEKGLNTKEFLSSLLNSLRTMILIKNQVTTDPDLNEISAKFTQDALLKLTNNLLKSQEQLKFTSIPSLPLEIAILETMASPVIPESLASRESIVPVIHNAPRHPELVSGSKTEIPDQVRNDNDQPQNDRGEVHDDKIEDRLPIPEKIEQIVITNSAEIVVIKDKWNYILETIRPYNYSLEALLKQAKVISCDGVLVILEVPYTFHQRILEAPKSRSLLESILSEVLGKEIRVTTILGSRPTRIEEIANVEVAADDEIIQIAADIFNS